MSPRWHPLEMAHFLVKVVPKRFVAVVRLCAASKYSNPMKSEGFDIL